MKNKGLKFFFICTTAIFADCVSAATIDNPFDPPPEQTLSLDEAYRQLVESEKALRQWRQDVERAYTELSKTRTRKLPEPKKICSYYEPYECHLNYYDVAQALLKEIACYLPKDKEQAEGFINNNRFLSIFYGDKRSKEIAADSVLRQSLEFQKKYPSNCFGD